MIKEKKGCSRPEDTDTKKKETEAVLFVPCTPGGKLQKLIQEEEDKFTSGTNLKRIRIVERGGTKLQDILCTSNPWEGQDCN